VVERQDPEERPQGRVHQHAPISEGESFELHFLAELYRVDIDQIRQLVAEHGLDRQALDQAVERLKSQT